MLNVNCRFGFELGGRWMVASPEVTPEATQHPSSTGSADASGNGLPAGARSSRIGLGSTPRILIVDDDATVREILADLLDDSGYRSIVAADAAEALSMLRRGGTIAALVTDLAMPGDDGIALIRKAREIDSTLPAILLTGDAEQPASKATIAGAPFHVLRKPVHIDGLIEQLRKLQVHPGV
jgi:CheY-like chemotaxis protein